MFVTFLSLSYLLALAALSYYRPIPSLFFTLFIFINTVSFLLYLLDKHKAKKGYWRIKESRLHLVSLLGGWPAAGIAQQLLKHKNRKTSFQIRYWLTVVANIAICTTLLYLFLGTNKPWL